jgi:hypothetical protein
MTMAARAPCHTPQMRRWRGLKSLIHDAVDATVELVREGHESTSRTVMRVTDEVPPLREPARVVDAVRRLGTSSVLGTIKVVNRSVQVVTDLGLDVALGEYDPRWCPFRSRRAPCRACTGWATPRWAW